MDLFSHLAVAIDFSEPSEVALKACFRLVEETGAKKVTVLHSIKPIVVPRNGPEAVQRRLTNLRERVHKAAVEELGVWCKKYDQPEGIELTLEVVEGSPTEAIPERAKEVGASVLLVGTHARKGLSRLFHGSVAERMLAGPLLPVLVLPTGDDGIPPDAELRELTRVLVAVDLSEGAANAVAEVAFEVAARFPNKPPVTVLSVAELPNVGSLHNDDDMSAALIEAVRAETEANLATLLERYADQVDIEGRVEIGDPDEIITQVANETEARLVVVGSHGHDVAPFLSLGSTTTSVVRKSNVSVLVVPSHTDSPS